MNDNIPLVHTGYTPIKPKRLVSVGPEHVKRLEAIAKAQPVYVTAEDMMRALIDIEYGKL
jgi:hypothetical protein